MNANEIRDQFIDFFRARGHRYVPGVPLVPADDSTLLFTNAGMNQFKDVFLGTGKRNYTRAVNAQKCMRVSGKHNDLEDVGRDTYHHTFFEMLGNWSFGDYYKAEAIRWAWSLFTEDWKMAPERLWATVYEKDDEAAKLWPRETDLPPRRVLRFDEKENFWEMAETGPCGPCSEIHIDMGEKHCSMRGVPSHRCEVNGGCGRFVEIWNLVFIQYNRDERGVLRELPRRHVDTGMGFERLVAVLQGANSNYATDLFMPILSALEEVSGRKYVPEGGEATAFRAIADHVRALTFAIADGALPSNEGRGYVLRMILRRAVRYGRLLGLEEPFLYRIVPVVASVMEKPYPELRQHAEHVSRVILSEEERFQNTLTFGLDLLGSIIKRVKARGRTEILAADIFRLYDTYGFPLDITRLVAREEGLKLDEEGFERLMAEQKRRARAAWKGAAADGASVVYRKAKERAGESVFCGYETTALEATIKALLRVEEETESLSEGEEGEIILDRTPFYAEAGGQVGDVGRLYTPRAMATVAATVTPIAGLISHRVRIVKGEMRTGEHVRAEVDSAKRMDTARHHTATHLLQSALRRVLGEHVKQAGSLVAADRLRFDFTHFTAMTARELARVEELVNERIREDARVRTYEMDFAGARGKDIIAVFGEKYGERVRVVDIGGYSRELCGGTHVDAVGRIGLFKILGESSVAAGVRRIEAVSGRAALRLFQKRERQVRELASLLKCEPASLVERVENLKREQKKLKKAATRASGEERIGDVSSLLRTARKVRGVDIVVADLKRMRMDSLRHAADCVREKMESGIIVLGARHEGKAQIVCTVTDDLIKRGVHAGRIAKMIAREVGGSGGGRPTMAQAGGPHADRLQEALSRAAGSIGDLLP